MQEQLKQLKPQIEASVEAAYEVANLALSQVERATELALAQSKQNAAFARQQIDAVSDLKDPAAVFHFLQGQLEASAKYAAAVATEQSIAMTLLMGFVVPFFFWVSMIGFVVYVHHTHVDVSWHEERTGWSKAAPFVSTTVHLTFPLHIGAMMHHIMEHTAHHVDMSIPLYRLKQAQAKLETLLPGRIIVQPFSWRWYFQTARSCKLYDFTRQCWTDYKGRATSQPPAGLPA